MAISVESTITTPDIEARSTPSRTSKERQFVELHLITELLRNAEYASKNINHIKQSNFRTTIFGDIFLVLYFYWGEHHKIPTTIEPFEKKMEHLGMFFDGADKLRIIEIVKVLLAKNSDGSWLFIHKPTWSGEETKHGDKH